jgi:hypothetical protein
VKKGQNGRISLRRLKPIVGCNASKRRRIIKYIKVKKVKVTLVQAPRLSTGRTAHRGSRGIAVLFHDHGTRKR